jgi:hypothetical protein
MQKVGLIVDMVNGALYNPSDTLAGTAVNTLSPAVVYKVGQYFKEEETEGSTKHLLAQALVAGVTAGLAGNDALSSALSAGGAEALAPKLASVLYGIDEKDVSKMTAEQKQTISAIISLAGTAIGATSGSVTDMVASGEAGRVAVEENFMFPVSPDEKPLSIEESRHFIKMILAIATPYEEFTEAKTNGDRLFAMAMAIPALKITKLEKIYEAYEKAKVAGDLKGMNKAINEARYQVGEFKTLKKNDIVGDKLDNHHVPQKQPAGNTIEGYDSKTAPAIKIDKKTHDKITAEQNANKVARSKMTPRELLADDVQMLRKHGVPNNKIQEIIQMTKNKYGLTK